MELINVLVFFDSLRLNTVRLEYLVNISSTRLDKDRKSFLLRTVILQNFLPV